LSHIPSIVAELSQFSAFIGRDIELVQGAGGNTSIKDGNTLWVKASGAWLADSINRNIFLPLDLGRIHSTIDAGGEDFSGCMVGITSERPSIETSLHALMPHRVVVHTHSVNALAWAVRTAGREQIANRLGGIDWLWIDYARPGLALAQAVRAAQVAKPDSQVLVLANHGLVIGADSVTDSRNLLEMVEKRLHVPARVWSAPRKQDLDDLLVPDARLPECTETHALARDTIGKTIAASGALYPDHAVFLGTSIPSFELTGTTESESLVCATLGEPPYCAIIRGGGVILGPKCSKAAEAMLACCALLSLRLDDSITLQYLPYDEVTALASWDMEKHRMLLQR